MNESPSTNWPSLLHILLKTAVLFTLCNLVFTAVQPLEWLGQWSLYNHILAGRERLPYGENPAVAYNLSTNNVPAMLQSHIVSQPKPAAEFRVFVVGDSSVWGWLLENEQTLTAQLNEANLQTADGRTVRFYNLGYPIISAAKDLLIIDAAMAHEPDMILWLVTLDALPIDKQLFPPLVQNNTERMRPLITQHTLQINPNDPRFVNPSFWEQTIIGQRRNLADLLRLQLYAPLWHTTRIDQAIPAAYDLRRSDFDTDPSWNTFTEPTTLTPNDLAFDVLQAGAATAGDTPLILINQPIFISTGQNSDLRYNSFYPRWAYDQYRTLLAEEAAAHQWPYLDLWDTVPPEEFTDTPVHLTARGTNDFAETLLGQIEAQLYER